MDEYMSGNYNNGTCIALAIDLSMYVDRLT